MVLRKRDSTYLPQLANQVPECDPSTTLRQHNLYMSDAGVICFDSRERTLLAARVHNTYHYLHPGFVGTKI